jgi:RNA polymerase sigma-70 factor (ECF subfamily)
MASYSNDSDLIAAFQRGDINATRQIYDLHYRAMCYYAERLIHNKQQAQDTAAEGFIKLLKKKHEFSKLAEIRSFLYTVTRNACFDYYRSVKRHNLSHHEMLYIFEPAEPAKDMEGINAEVIQEIYQEIEKLPPQCRQVFKLLFFKGLNTEEAARELNISTKTVLNQKGKAIKLMRMALLRKDLLIAIILIDMLASFLCKS